MRARAAGTHHAARPIMRPATSPSVPTGSNQRLVPEDEQRRQLAHHKARMRLVGFTALLAVGVAGILLFALQHAWITAAIFAVLVVPMLIIALAAHTRQIRKKQS